MVSSYTFSRIEIQSHHLNIIILGMRSFHCCIYDFMTREIICLTVDTTAKTIRLIYNSLSREEWCQQKPNVMFLINATQMFLLKVKNLSVIFQMITERRKEKRKRITWINFL